MEHHQGVLFTQTQCIAVDESSVQNPDIVYSKTCVKRPLSKRPKIRFQDQLSLNAGQKYCRMLQRGQQSSIISTFIKLPFVNKIFVLSI